MRSGPSGTSKETPNHFARQSDLVYLEKLSPNRTLGARAVHFNSPRPRTNEACRCKQRLSDRISYPDMQTGDLLLHNEPLLQAKDLLELLTDMGWETANIHLASKDAIKSVKQDLSKRPDGWLQAASKEMVTLLESDWEDWKRNREVEFDALRT